MTKKKVQVQGAQIPRSDSQLTYVRLGYRYATLHGTEEGCSATQTRSGALQADRRNHCANLDMQQSDAIFFKASSTI